MPGLFYGTLKGLTGLVAKPIVGLFDGTSKIAEGIKNQILKFDEESEVRKRPPRAFYGSERYFKEYSQSDAELMGLL